MATRRTARTLQPKLDRMLASCIEDVRSLGYEPVGTIEPHVRITSNDRRLGSCAETTGAYYRRRSDKRGVRRLRAGAHPNFLISCSVNAGASDAEFRDVLYHEVIHTLPGCFSHGSEFKRVASHVNEAFGANVQTTKRDEWVDADRGDAVPVDEMRRRLAPIVGRELEVRGKRYRLTGLNDRPKRFCDLIDLSTGKQYVSGPEFVLDAKVIPASDGHQSANVPREATSPKGHGGEADKLARERVAALVGKEIRIGNRTFRFVGMTPRPKNCCDLFEPSTGQSYRTTAEAILSGTVIN